MSSFRLTPLLCAAVLLTCTACAPSLPSQSSGSPDKSSAPAVSQSVLPEPEAGSTPPEASVLDAFLGNVGPRHIRPILSRGAIPRVPGEALSQGRYPHPCAVAGAKHCPTSTHAGSAGTVTPRSSRAGSETVRRPLQLLPARPGELSRGKRLLFRRRLCGGFPQ